MDITRAGGVLLSLSYLPNGFLQWILLDCGRIAEFVILAQCFFVVGVTWVGGYCLVCHICQMCFRGES